MRKNSGEPRNNETMQTKCKVLALEFIIRNKVSTYSTLLLQITIFGDTLCCDWGWATRLGWTPRCARATLFCSSFFVVLLGNSLGQVLLAGISGQKKGLPKMIREFTSCVAGRWGMYSQSGRWWD